MLIDCSTFERYDSAATQVAELQGVDEALQVARDNSHRTQAELRHTTKQLAHARTRAAHHKMKLEKCKHHTLLKHTAFQPGTWFTGGIGERIKRQQAKLNHKEAEASDLAANERRLGSQVGALETDVKALNGALARKKSSEDECSQLVEAVSAAHPTAALASMHEQQGQWAQVFAAEQQSAESVAQITAALRRAKAAYQQAERCLQQASSANTGAQFNNFLGGDNFGFELVEHVQQAQRNQLMHEAGRRVHEGAQLMKSVVPSAALVQRFPDLARLRQVHVPTVEQAGLGEGFLEIFGGDFGDAIAGFTAANKIGRSIGVVRECVVIVDGQMRIALAAHQALQSAVHDADSVLQRISQDIAVEKRNIFDAVRAAMCPTPTRPLPSQSQKGAVPITVATAVPHADPNLPTALSFMPGAGQHDGPVAVAVPIPVAVGHAVGIPE